MWNRILNPIKVSMAAHSALGLIFTAMLAYYLFRDGEAFFFELGQLYGGANRWGELDTHTGNIAAILIFCGAVACFSWMGFIHDLKLLRQKSLSENVDASGTPRREGDAE